MNELGGCDAKAGALVMGLDNQHSAGNYGRLVLEPGGVFVRRATREDLQLASEAALRCLDPDAAFDVVGVGRCRLEQSVAGVCL